MTPTGALGQGPTRALCALLAVYARDGRATIRTVQAEGGYRSSGSLWKQLRVLRAAELIAFDDALRGTLRPLVQAVPFKAAA